MLPIKRLYTYIYQTFFPLFVMTFGICHFIFIIQFLWQHIDKLVGKGLETIVILELFSYLALMLVPQVLPLAILLASLMTFGNLGERLELLAIKASGVSLMQIMKPMIILVMFIALGSFYFQNNLSPTLQVKVYSLLYSIRQKSPALNIPEGAFYSEITGYSIYVKKKDLETGMLHDVIIYDLSKGSAANNIAVDVCDSAMMFMGEDRDYLTLTMYNGESFQNFKKETGRRKTESAENLPFISQVFKQKEVIVPFNEELERIDESRWDDSQLSKGLTSLQVAIDSMTKQVDSLNVVDRKAVSNLSTIGYRSRQPYLDSLEQAKELGIKKHEIAALDFDSVFKSYSRASKKDILSTASLEARNKASNRIAFHHLDTPKSLTQRNIRLHKIYWHKMFALPFACVIFFFIGAPLGAIIKKGGLGVPVILSVILFIVYYIIGNIGYKMARDGVWAEWQGEWLSAAVLFPLGVFLTYKSTKESSLFNVDLYGRYLKKLFRVKDTEVYLKNAKVIRIEIPKVEELTRDAKKIADFRALNIEDLKDMALNYASYGHDEDMKLLALSVLLERNEDIEQFMKKDDYELRHNLISDFDNTSYIAIFAYFVDLIIYIGSFWGGGVILVSYIFIYIRAILLYSSYISLKEKQFKNKKYYIKHTLIMILALFAYPIVYLYMRKVMHDDMDEVKNTSLQYVKK